jgi:acylpyruvate hydrolase
MSAIRNAINADLQSLKLPSLSGNIYAIGRNYADHAKELNNPVPKQPVVFLKAPSSLRLAAEGPLAFANEEFHHELELVFLCDPQADLSWDSLVGVSLGLDLTRRGVQSELKAKGLPWTLAKSFAGAAVLGPWQRLEADWWQEPIDLSLEVNGELRQHGDHSQMIFSLPQILSFLNQQQPIEPGDLIFSGTPAGVGPLRKGDRFRMISRRLQIDCHGQL